MHHAGAVPDLVSEVSAGVHLPNKIAGQSTSQSCNLQQHICPQLQIDVPVTEFLLVPDVEFLSYNLPRCIARLGITAHDDEDVSQSAKALQFELQHLGILNQYSLYVPTFTESHRASWLQIEDQEQMALQLPTPPILASQYSLDSFLVLSGQHEASWSCNTTCWTALACRICSAQNLQNTTLTILGDDDHDGVCSTVRSLHSVCTCAKIAIDA